MIERTLVVLKSDSVLRGIMWEIITRFERVWLKMIWAKMLNVSEDLADKHYPASRTPFIDGMGGKTLENYKKLWIDPIKELWTDDPHEIWLRIREWLIKYISCAPVLAMVWEGPHAVELVRKLCWATLPLLSAPGTIRWDYSYDSSALANRANRAIINLIHASWDLEEAKYEVDLWFKQNELVSYQRSDEAVRNSY